MQSHFSHVWPYATLWTVASQAPLSMGFSRQECWSGLPCPPLQGIFLTPRWNSHLLCLLHWQGGFLPPAPPGKPKLEGLFSTGSRKRKTAGVKHMPMNFTTELNLRFILLTHIYSVPFTHCGLPRWLSSKESACQCKRPKFDPWIRKVPWRRKWQPTPVFLPRKSHGQGSLVG